MKRTLLSAVGVCALALTIPGAALAHQGHETSHHHKHHHRTQHRPFHIVHIRPGSVHISPSAAPGAPTSPHPGNSGTPGASQNAATVMSFTGGVLTLKLSDGSTLSGTVTNRTEIECRQASPRPTAATADEHGNRGPGGDGQGGPAGNDNGHHNGHDDGNDNGDGNGGPVSGEQPPCDSTALVPGAIVHAAELRVGPTGSEFTNIRLSR